MKNNVWLFIPIAFDPSKEKVANIPENPVPVEKSPTMPLGKPFKNPRVTASPKLWEIPLKILEATATQKKAAMVLFIQANAIIKNDPKVKTVIIKILVWWRTLTQHAPFTSLDDAPKIIMKNKNRPMNDSWLKSLAKSDAAA